MRTKDEFHSLIDKIEDEELLKSYLQLIQRLNSHQTGLLWDSLSFSQKEELMLSYEESFDPKNLVSHEEVKNKHSRWLKK